MAVTYSSFVAVFTEFADITAFPQTTVEFWLSQAPFQLNANRLRNSYDLAVMLFTAHNLVLGKRDARSASAGGTPGQVSGPQASKSVDKVSVSYDTGAATYPGAGEWNATSYGLRLYRLLRAAGAGPIYVLPCA
ncbi:DUF4054 domain-containing protein [Bosea sp. ASV33]|uniref:DUF4054 domain-containing protein n=1 Tax=Bosea sp. ASV33 TaxID=2795106 RepID=UPI0018ECF0F5|nr:DUF4054 domain-containing protein [Bosea sp. ASV33]